MSRLFVTLFTLVITTNTVSAAIVDIQLANIPHANTFVLFGTVSNAEVEPGFGPNGGLAAFNLELTSADTLDLATLSGERTGGAQTGFIVDTTQISLTQIGAGQLPDPSQQPVADLVFGFGQTDGTIPNEVGGGDISFFGPRALLGVGTYSGADPSATAVSASVWKQPGVSGNLSVNGLDGTDLDPDDGDVQVITTTIPMGDMNLDGHIDVDDINPFIQGLTGGTGYQDRFGIPATLLGDFSGNDILDVDDINPFINALQGGGAGTFSTSSIPEPTSIAFLSLTTIALIRRKSSNA